MGTHDWRDNDKPDIQIERRPHGWAIFINPDAGDTVAYVYILDSGETYLVPENCARPSLSIVEEAPPEIDAP
jgi:hypothetical protein